MTAYVWSVDDAGSGGSAMVESLRRTCRFLESRGLRASWFVVPEPRGEPLTGEWKQALLEARDAGHDLQLHGLTHGDCYEFGPPAWPATIISPTFLADFESRREEAMPRYTVEKLQARIERGMELFERDLGVRPTLFRAPCGAVSRPMFEALRRVGIAYHTCEYISATGYEFLPHRGGRLQQEWRDAIPHRPFRWYSGIIEVPILNEYTWRGASAREPEMVSLAKQDVDRIAPESPVAVLLMHTHGIADDYDYAFRLIDSVAEHLERRRDARFATLGELAASGALEEAATVEGPDTLAV
jgi:peptidoglycan/xylan/chitin deacetylase (PgdA/CDA1 family)